MKKTPYTPHPQQKTSFYSKSNIPTPYGQYAISAIFRRTLHVVFGIEPKVLGYNYDQVKRNWVADHRYLGGHMPNAKRFRVHTIFSYNRVAHCRDIQIGKKVSLVNRKPIRFDCGLFITASLQEAICASIVSLGKIIIALYSYKENNPHAIIVMALIVGMIKGFGKYMSYLKLQDINSKNAIEVTLKEMPINLFKCTFLETMAEILTGVVVIARGKSTDAKLKTALKSAFKHFFANAIERRMNLNFFWSEIRSCIPEFFKGGFKAICRELCKVLLSMIVFPFILSTAFNSMILSHFSGFIGSVLAVMLLNVFIDSSMGTFDTEVIKGE